MAFLAVVDACALYPLALRDTLLRLAELELYDVQWSERILEEMRTSSSTTAQPMSRPTVSSPP